MKEIIEEVFNQIMDEACTNPLHRFSELLLERVQKTDIFIHEEIERLKAEIKRANELAEYRLKLLMQMPENKPEPWDTKDMAHRSGGLTVDQEINRLTDLNQRLVAAAKELGYADDTHEWDDAWSKMCKLIKEVG